MLEMKLLDLAAEYASYEADEATFKSVGMAHERSREEIATEYGETLRKFLKS